MINPIDKPQKIRSKKIRDSAKGESCTLRVSSPCASNETTVFCHAPSMSNGMGTKSDDYWGAYGCYYCHLKADSGQISEADWMRAIHETQKRLIQKNLLNIN